MSDGVCCSVGDGVCGAVSDGVCMVCVEIS